MAIPAVWIERTQTQVAQLLADYPSLANLGNAFNVWAMIQIHGLTEEDALEATANRLQGPGDGGLDAVYSDDLAQVLYLLQSKYSQTLTSSYDESAAQELFGGLDLLMNAEYASRAGADFLSIRERLVGALAGGSDVVLQVVLGGTITHEARQRAQTYVESLGDSRIRLDIVTIDDLWQLDSDQAQGADLSDEWVPMIVVGDPLEVPSTAEGLTSAHIAVVDAASLMPAVDKFGRRLVANNLRHLLKRSAINDSIGKSTTTRELRQRFPLLNNGLTITCEAIEIGNLEIRLKNPQIVNGGQTTMTLHANRFNFGPGDIHVIARIVATSGDTGRKLALDIAEATNRQNPITPADLKANDDRQKALQSAMAAISPPWFYERRRNEQASLPPGQLRTFVGVITKEDLGQRWRAFSGNPAAAITGKQEMFVQQDLYGETYSSAVDVRVYVLAHQLFEFYYDVLGNSAASARLRKALSLPITESERGELARARNQWAAHCAAVTAHVLRSSYGQVSPLLASRLSAEIRGPIREGSGQFEGVIRLVMVAIHKWFRNKKLVAQDEGTILAVKAEFEKPNTFAVLKSEVEALQALVGDLSEFAMPAEL